MKAQHFFVINIFASVLVLVVVLMTTCGCSQEHLKPAADIIVAAKPAADVLAVTPPVTPIGIYIALFGNILSSIAAAIVAARREKAIKT